MRSWTSTLFCLLPTWYGIQVLVWKGVQDSNSPVHTAFRIEGETISTQKESTTESVSTFICRRHGRGGREVCTGHQKLGTETHTGRRTV